MLVFSIEIVAYFATKIAIYWMMILKCAEFDRRKIEHGTLD